MGPFQIGDTVIRPNIKYKDMGPIVLFGIVTHIRDDIDSGYRYIICYKKKNLRDKTFSTQPVRGGEIHFSNIVLTEKTLPYFR